MKKTLLSVLLWMAPIAVMAVNCGLTEYRWLCQIPIQTNGSNRAPSVIDCGGTEVYVTRSQYEEIMRYQRASVNMTLNVHGEYVSSPCVPKQYLPPKIYKARKFYLPTAVED